MRSLNLRLRVAYHCDQPQISGLQTLDNLAGSDGRHNAGTAWLHLSRRVAGAALRWPMMTKTLGVSMWTNGTNGTMRSSAKGMMKMLNVRISKGCLII